MALLLPLAEELVDEEVYAQAVDAGQSALDDAMDEIAAEAQDAILEDVTSWVQQFADDVPDRMRARVEQIVADNPDAEDLASVLDIDLEGFRYSVTRYAEPIINAGMQSYGQGLDNNEVLLVWQLNGEDNCDDCPDIADASPYTADALPTWPKNGDTQCRDNCNCTIEADPDSWDAYFNNSQEEA